MSLSLTAEKKNLSEVFSTQNQYIIPPYQRPYSWTVNECLQMYQDFIAAYNNKEDYFIGNIILAVSNGNREPSRLVDGQQRLITLWIIFKVLSTFYEDLPILQEVIRVYNWDRSESDIRIKSEIIESDDSKLLDKIFSWSYNDFEEDLNKYKQPNNEIRFTSTIKSIEKNSLFYFNRFVNCRSDYGDQYLRGFIRFILEQVYILPIELSNQNISEAENSALSIFETINNRGLLLEDADIFKARLYAKATTPENKKDFIDQWLRFKEECQELNLNIDEIFRYYSHIIRGRNGITRSEISMRDFFTGENSPISQQCYQQIMDDLSSIINLLNEYNEHIHEKTELGAWLQLIEVYSNRYPKYAVITYLFKNGFSNETELLTLLKSLVRYCYHYGALSSVKFEIYVIIKQISQDLPVSDYRRNDICINSFTYLGRLKYAFALLAHYLEDPVCIPDFNTDRILASRDANSLTQDWNLETFWNTLDDLGNLAILDIPKVNRIYSQKRNEYLKTNIAELKDFLQKNQTVSFNSIEHRSQYKKNLLLEFFTNK